MGGLNENTSDVIFLKGKSNNANRENIRAQSDVGDDIKGTGAPVTAISLTPSISSEDRSYPESSSNIARKIQSQHLISETISKAVQLPTVPLPIFANVSTRSGDKSIPSQISDHIVVCTTSSSNYGTNSRVPSTIIITTGTKTNTSETWQHPDVSTCSTLPNVSISLNKVSEGAAIQSSSGARSTSPPIFPSHSLTGTEEQSSLEGTSSSVSLSNIINFSSSVAPSSPASYKTTTSSMRPTSHPSATFSMSSRSPSPAYSNPNSVTSSQDVILSEPGCGSGRPSVDSPAISATYSDMGAPSEGNDVSDGISQTSSVDQELKEEIAHSTKSEQNLFASGASINIVTSAPSDGRMARDLGLKIPVSEIDPSILPKTFIKGKVCTTVTASNRSGPNVTLSTTLINKMRPPKGTVNLERSQEICRTAIAKSPNWVQVDPNIVGASLQQIGAGQSPTKIIQATTANSSTGSASVPSIIINSSTTNNILPIGSGGSNTRPSLGNVVPITIRPSISNASGSVQIMALPSTISASTPGSGVRGTVTYSSPGHGNFTNAVLVNAANNKVITAH
jgi:hypothetical protein